MEEFYRNRTRPDGRNPWCASCFSQYRAEQRRKPSFRSRERMKDRSSRITRYTKDPTLSKCETLRTKYGITYEEKLRMLENQGWVCANKACKKKLDMTTGGVDHCHSTGKVRGILCINCNVGLGNFMDSAEKLLGAINYLKEV